MLSPDLLRRINRIEFKTRKRVSNAFIGAYHSLYRGRGLIFASVRPYIPGDDVRTIDWKVTARAGEPFVKQFIEDRELTVMLVVDGSASVLFGTSDRQKRDAIAELGAVLAYIAAANNDKAGLLVFSDRIERYLPPRKGRNHNLQLIRELLTIEPQGTGTDLALALRTLTRVVGQGAIVFVLSDFLLPEDAYYRELVVAAQHHEIITLVVSDPLEEQFPAVGMLRLRDAETGAVQLVDTSSAEWRQRFVARRQDISRQRDSALKRAGVARIDMPPDGDYIRTLAHFFQQQSQQR
jgi:uncharacterized protein (DUF58 family)